MGYRLFDWACTLCGLERESLTWVKDKKRPPEKAMLACLTCRMPTRHARIVSVVAEYHGEKTLNPIVHGGAFDTAGSKPLPGMDALPSIPLDASRADRKQQVEAYRQRFASAEWKDMKKQRASIMKDNAEKKQRLAALKRGENVNMRRDKLPGDPKVTA